MSSTTPQDVSSHIISVDIRAFTPLKELQCLKRMLNTNRRLLKKSARKNNKAETQAYARSWIYLEASSIFFRQVFAFILQIIITFALRSLEKENLKKCTQL